MIKRDGRKSSQKILITFVLALPYLLGLIFSGQSPQGLTLNFSFFFRETILRFPFLLFAIWAFKTFPLPHSQTGRIRSLLWIIPLVITSLGLGYLLKPNQSSWVSQGSPWTYMMGAILLALVTATTEECFFRGWLLGILPPHQKNTFVWGLISAASFAIIHFWEGPQTVFLAFLSGLFYAWVYKKTHRLLPLILAHTLHNTLAFMLLLIR